MELLFKRGVRWASLRREYRLEELKEARGWALRVPGEEHSKQGEQPPQSLLFALRPPPLCTHIFHPSVRPLTEVKSVRGSGSLGRRSWCIPWGRYPVMANVAVSPHATLTRPEAHTPTPARSGPDVHAHTRTERPTRCGRREGLGYCLPGRTA